MKELSRAPQPHPNQTAEELRAMIVEAKLRHQRWGPKKVLDCLHREQPQLKWPADSTAGEILKRAGLVQPRRRRRRVAPYTQPFSECGGPNQSWSADFKGDFRLGNGRRCYPLTVSDNFSRYLLLCRALERPSNEEVQPWFEWVFREYGFPEAIRTDNGAPFASLAVGGISQLSKWWIKLGIKPERIRPGKPAQNGRHERMHRTLEEECRRKEIFPRSNATSIRSERNITGSVPMRPWEEKLPAVFMALPHDPIRSNSQRLITSRESRLGTCAITARSSGGVSSSTSRKSWPKSRWDLSL